MSILATGTYQLVKHVVLLVYVSIESLVIGREPLYSSGGYLTVDDPWRTPLAQAYVDAGVELGYENR